MLLGCIADDFTGASDLANTLVKAGMASIQFIGVPSGAAPVDCEAGVVALKTRSVHPDEAIEKSLAALQWLRQQGCRQFVFKYCSTFDSTPDGNIGPVAAALQRALSAGAVAFCPAFPATGRTVYMGHLFVGDMLINHSGMEKHPLNPMTEPDIRRWLARQSDVGVGFVSLSEVRRSPKAIADALDREESQGRPFVVVDAIADEDLLAIGEALSGATLVTGASGIAMGLPGNFRRLGLLVGEHTPVVGVAELGAVLSGSCSLATQEQVIVYRREHPSLMIKPVEIATGRQTVDEAAAFCALNADRDPLVYSTAEANAVAQAQSALGVAGAAASLEKFMGELARRLVDQGVRRLVVAGGETAGAVVEALGVSAMRIGGEIDPGVPLLFSLSEPTLGLALKSGNFGSRDFFAVALRRLRLP